MTREELNVILEKHKKWLNGEEDGERANLSRADLREADLREANLSRADLREADLREANLSRADLSGSDLREANLSRADLREANLSRADLRETNLSEANLSWANLRGANLRGANLCGANLCRSDLDYSCLPLWCGSLSAQFDDRQLKQIAYHLVKSGLSSPNASAATKKELAKLIYFANEFHRVKECGRIKKGELNGRQTDSIVDADQE